MQALCADSDGRIDTFISAAGSKAPASTLKLHELKPGEPYLLGMFLTGAYQEVRHFAGLTLLSPRMMSDMRHEAKMHVSPARTTSHLHHAATLCPGHPQPACCHYAMLLAALQAHISDGECILLAGHGVSSQHVWHPQCGHCALQQLLQQQPAW